MSKLTDERPLNIECSNLNYNQTPVSLIDETGFKMAEAIIALSCKSKYESYPNNERNACIQNTTSKTCMNARHQKVIFSQRYIWSMECSMLIIKINF